MLSAVSVWPSACLSLGLSFFFAALLNVTQLAMLPCCRAAVLFPSGLVWSGLVHPSISQSASMCPACQSPMSAPAAISSQKRWDEKLAPRFDPSSRSRFVHQPDGVIPRVSSPGPWALGPWAWGLWPGAWVLTDGSSMPSFLSVSAAVCLRLRHLRLLHVTIFGLFSRPALHSCNHPILPTGCGNKHREGRPV